MLVYVCAIVQVWKSEDNLQGVGSLLLPPGCQRLSAGPQA